MSNSNTKSHGEIFSKIYAKRIWAGNDKTPLSGSGSTVRYNRKYMDFLAKFINEPKHHISKIVDFGCGDWTFTRELCFGDSHYLGIDCVESVIEANKKQFASEIVEFQLADFSLPEVIKPYLDADLLIFKDVLQHWSDSEIVTLLDFIIEHFNDSSGRVPYLLLVHGKRRPECFNKPRSVDNYYHYSNLHFSCPPLNRYKIQHLFDYQYKEVGLLQLNGSKTYKIE